MTDAFPKPLDPNYYNVRTSSSYPDPNHPYVDNGIWPEPLDVDEGEVPCQQSPASPALFKA